MAEDNKRKRKKQNAAEQRRRRAERNKAREKDTDSSLLSSAGNYLKEGIKYGMIGTASAVLMYRTGFAPAISRGLNFSARFLKQTAKSTVWNKELGDWTINEARQLKGDMSNAWKDASKALREKSIRLNNADSRNMFGLMRKVREDRANHYTDYAQKAWRQNLINKTRHRLAKGNQRLRNQMDENEYGRYDRFIQDIVSTAHNKDAMRIAKHKAGFDKGTEEKIADHIIKSINRWDKPEDKSKFMKDFQDKLQKSIEEKVLDINKLEKEFGQAHKSPWEEWTGTKGLTVKDILGHKDKTSSPKYQVSGKPEGLDFDSIQDLEEFREYYRQRDIEKGLDAKAIKGTDAYEKYQANSEELRFLNLTPDAKGLRKDAFLNYYSNDDSHSFVDTLLNDAAKLLPGKIAKLRDVETSRQTPQIFFAARGSIDPGLAALSNLKENKKSMQIDSDMLYIMGDWYRVKEDSLELAPELKDIKTTLISGEFGSRKHMHHQMSGNLRYKGSSNSILSKFDIGQDRSEFKGFDLINEYNARFNKENNREYFPNIVRDMLDPTVEDAAARKGGVDIEWRDDYLYRAGILRDNLTKLTYSLNRDSAKRLSEMDGLSDRAKDILNQLMSGDYTSMVEYMQTSDIDNFILDDLKTVAKKSKSNIHSLDKHIAQKVAQEKTNMSTSIFDLPDTTPGNYTEDAEEYLRNKFSRELFAEIATTEDGAKDYNRVYALLQDANLDTREYTNASRLTSLTYLEQRSQIHFNGFKEDSFSDNQLWETTNTLYDMFTSKGESSYEHVQHDIKTIAAENKHLFEAAYDDVDEIANPLRYNEFVTQRETTGVLDVLSSLNSWTKFKDTFRHFGAQFIAGRDNMGDVSNATYVPYFFLSRLSDEMNKVGLGFSKDNMGSTLDMASAMFTKRILPIGIAASYAEWTDDTAEEITGMSISGAMAQGVAEVDVAGRKVLDAIGLTDWLKKEKAINPIMQYWGDHDEFMSADERREWYEEGFSPVRKGAWWTFGGVNEARGSEISYWEPTFVRRIQSDYKDKALYDGYFDKWSHSLLPTPSNPLSPLMAILDPYWLEERHKDDRPYELSGHMFADGTPWGAVLNDTIGDIIKPQKSMHTIGKWLPFTDGFDYRNINGVDPKALLYATNSWIRQKARDLGGRNQIQLHGDQLTPVDVDLYDAPTPDTSVASFQFKGGTYNSVSAGVYGTYAASGELAGNAGFGGGSGKELSAKSLDEIGTGHIGFKEAIDHTVFGGMKPHQGVEIATGNGGSLYLATKTNKIKKEDRELTAEEEFSIASLISRDEDAVDNKELSILSRFVNPRNWLKAINQQTKGGEAKHVSPFEFDKEEGAVHGDKLKSYRPSAAMDFLSDPDEVTQLINQTKGQGVVENGAVSWRLISGIYGYALGAATGIGVDDAKRVATGQDMTSFSRTFWDENLGGLGGPAAEIMRRFVPDYRRGPRNNPLMNEMPDWLPERFRFGDPYTQIQKGEMRLPGKGWESLNEKHGDQFGDYGAFDRMKILADIAPFSPEYRMWRDIAKKTVTNPELVEEMDEIKDRVNQQGKKHDFYDYKVIGHGVDYKRITVSEILGYGKFRSGNTIYKIAGASVRGNENESMKDVLGRYIHVGEDITVAVDENNDTRHNKDSIQSINAAVFVDGENVGQQMIANGDASLRKGDANSAALLAQYGPMQRMLAWGSEFVAHMDVPWLSDQFLRVRSPLESYEAEQVYGTPYQSWEHPIDSMLLPALERSFHDRSALTGTFGAIYRMSREVEGLPPGIQKLASAGFIFGDRGAFIGAALGNLVTGGDSKIGMRWARYGSEIATLGHALTGGNSVIDESLSVANLADEVGRFFKEDTRARGRLAAIGAGIGAVYHVLKNHDGDWVPDRTKDKWELEDYFDRLTYLKYQGLYKAAAAKAKEEEDVDLDEVIRKRTIETQKNQAAIERFKNLKKELQRNARESDVRSEAISKLNKKIEKLESATLIAPGGEWTRTALLYKKAADSTMYALKDNSSWSQIVTALPTNDREYFMEFVKEGDKSKREEILSTVSPFLKKALQLAWGQYNPRDAESNESYFKRHELPVANWAGWAPQYDLNNIEVKTIENEAMNLSDFGFYDSQTKDEKVINAPAVRFRGTSQGHNEAMLKENLSKILHGQGLKNVDISVEAGPNGGGTTIMAAVKTMLGIRQQEKQVQNSLQMQSY